MPLMNTLPTSALAIASESSHILEIVATHGHCRKGRYALVRVQNSGERELVSDSESTIPDASGDLPPFVAGQVGAVALTHRVPRSGLVVWQGPSVGSTVVEELAPALAVGIVQVHRHFALVSTESRVVGWVDARALLPIRGSGERWMQPAALASIPGLAALAAAGVCLFTQLLKLPDSLSPSEVSFETGSASKISVDWLWHWGDDSFTGFESTGFTLAQFFFVLITISAIGFLLSLLRVRIGKLVARIGTILLAAGALAWAIRCIHFVNQIEDFVRQLLGNSARGDQIVAARDLSRFELTGNGTFGLVAFSLLALVAACWPAPKPQRQR